MTTRGPASSERVNLLFPLDSQNRELDARLFIAGLCARDETRTFVGQHDVIYGLLPLMHGGVYLGKHIFPRIFTDPKLDSDRYKLLKRQEFAFIHLDEEGGVFPGSEPEQWKDALNIQLDPRVLDAGTTYARGGAFRRATTLPREPACAQNIKTTGHPRFDLYKSVYRRYFDDEVKELRDTHGDFILYNTTFAAAQPKFGIGDWFSSRRYDPDSPFQQSRSIAIWADDTRKLSYAVPLCHRLACAFPDRTIVIRPHPSEDASVYQAVFDVLPNVVVVNEGHVAPWLLACETLIHSGCTTGMEAFLADTPVLYYRPGMGENDAADSLLAGMFGVPCLTPEDVVERILGGGDGIVRAQPEVDPRAHDLVANLRCDAISPLVDVILDVAARQRPTAGPAPRALPYGA